MLFIVYVIVSCVLLFNTNPYQHSVYLTSANAISSSIYRGANSVTSYFNLRDINYELQANNAALDQQVLQLKAQLQRYREQTLADSSTTSPILNRYTYTIAHVINNSISRPHNFITIDKGYEDGIKPEMGVVDQNGVVGIVNVVGRHSSRVISVLNNSLRISCKLRKSQQIGSLVWDGRTPTAAVLEEVPRHAVWAKGDTVVTSGYSTTFPEGVPVGVVTGLMKDHDENFLALRIKMFTDFSTLSTVRIISDALKDELEALEQTDESEEKSIYN